MSKSGISNINKLKYDEDVFFLHPAQESVYFEQQLHPDNPMYNIGGYQVIERYCDINIMQKAWEHLYEKLDTLRFSLSFGEDILPRQYILGASSPPVSLELYDFSDSSYSHENATQWIREQFDAPMDIINGERHQVALLKIEEEKYYLLLRFHHLFIDGLGVYRLFERFHQVYDSLCSNHSLSWLDALPQYQEQVINMREYIGSSRYERGKKYWQSLLDNNEVTRLPRYYPCAGSSESRCELATSLTNQLNQYCDKHRVSLLALLTGVLSVYFSRTLDKDNLVLGTAVHGRTNKKSQQVIGMFSNIIPMVCNVLPDENFVDYVRQVARQLLKSFRHSRFPASHIARLSHNEAGHLSDIHVLYEKFENTPQAIDLIPAVDHAMDIISISSRHDKQPLQIRLIDYQSNHKLALRVNYLNQCYDHHEIGQLMSRLINMLKFVVEHEDARVDGIPLMFDSDIEFELKKDQLVVAFEPQNQTLNQLVEHHAQNTPDNTALIFEGQKLTYDELNKKANQLAQVVRLQYETIRGKQIKPDTLIALCCDRSIEMVVSILAVLKTGAAYLPIDPKAPKERIQFIIEDAQTEVVLTRDHQLARLDSIISELESSPLLITVDTNEVTKGLRSENLSVSTHASHLAYVIYTSGTTGKPKGVLQTHHNVVRLLGATQNDFQFNAGDVWVLYHAYTFDFSVWELWGALLNGGALLIPSADMIRDLPSFVEECKKHKVSVLNQTPAAFYSFSEQVTTTYGLWPQLRYVIFGGDKLNLAQLAPWWQQYGDEYPKLVNMYGITETTVHVTYKPLSLHDAHSASHIGRPISDMHCYVLNAEQQPVPTGTPGELYVGGAGLARGYLNRPELTAERFVGNPYATQSDYDKGYDRLYKTGDLVRRLSDGNLEYLGRNDFQVKIRGYRIELGEIEAALVAVSEVRQAVVIDRERDGHKYLAAYVVSDTSCTVVTAQLQDTLAATLPDYMLPATFSIIEAIPLTSNGKLDRQRLPEPEFVDADSYLAPRSALEDQLCRIWQQVLGLPLVGIQDNFFHIGGDSIICIELVSVLRREGLTVKTKDIFDAPTVAQLAVRINRGVVDTDVVAEQGELTGEFGLLPIQQQFFDKHLAKPHHWNQAFIVDIPVIIEEAMLAGAISKLVSQHDMLRCRFSQSADGQFKNVYITERYVSVTPYKINTASISDDELYDVLSNIQNCLNYSTGPLWQVAYLTGYSDGRTRLWFAFHHLIIDAVSWRIIVDDLRYLLSGGLLGNKTSSYRQWVAAVYDYATQHRRELPYWQSVLDDQVSFPVSKDTQICTFALSESLTDVLLREVNSGYQTEINDLLLSALAIALNKVFKTPVSHITLEAHGRDGIDTTLDASRTVGWFTTTYPVRLRDTGDIGSTIVEIKRMLRAIPNKGVGYGALWQSGMIVGGSLPEISFNYFGQFNNRQNSFEHSDWTISSHGIGQTIAEKNRKPVLLDINGVISGGALEFRIESGLSNEQSASLVQSFENALVGVIEHAKSVVLATQALDEANTMLADGYVLPGNRQWYFQRTKELERWGPCVLFEFIDSNHYHLQMKQAVEAVVHLHQGLRVNIIGEGDGRTERIRLSDSFECFSYQDCSVMPEADIERLLAEFRDSIDFSQSLVRFLYCDLGAGEQDKLYIVIHHLAMDRYSLSIFFRDLLAAFDAIIQGQKPALTCVGSSFGDWVHECSSWLSSADAHASLQFWREKLVQNVTPLPTDYTFSHQANNIGTRREVEHALDLEITKRLKSVAVSYGLNEYYFVITAIAKRLSDWCGGGPVCFEEVMVGREHFDTLDLSGTVGWLNDYLPIFVNPDTGKTDVELVRSVRDEILACKEHGKGFCDLKFNASQQDDADISGLISPEIDINFIPESLSINQDAFRDSRVNLVRYDEMVGIEREAIHKLSCTVSFVKGRLTFTWEYGEQIYKRVTVERLAAACADQLIELAESHRL